MYTLPKDRLLGPDSELSSCSLVVDSLAFTDSNMLHHTLTFVQLCRFNTRCYHYSISISLSVQHDSAGVSHLGPLCVDLLTRCVDVNRNFPVI